MANFKEDLIQKLNDKNLSEGSIKLYLRNLEKLNDGNLQSFKFLNNVEKIVEKITKYKPNTQRGILISIVSVLGCCPEDKKLMKIRNKYYNLMNDKNTEIKENATDEPTEEQKANWISWDDVKKKFEELKSEVNKFKDNKKISEKFEKIEPIVNGSKFMSLKLDDKYQVDVWHVETKEKFWETYSRHVIEKNKLIYINKFLKNN